MRSIVIPAVGVIGVRDRDAGPELPPDLSTPFPPPSPSLTRASIDLSRLPPRPFKTFRFLLSSLKPISRSLASFDSKSSGLSTPNTRDGLFLLGGEGDLSRESGRAAAASRRALEDNGKIDEADLKPNLLPVFGGRGGGWSSEFVLPVFCRACALTTLSWYFCLMNLSIAESASSASNGTGGLVLSGLYIRFDATFPTRFIFSTCSVDQESMLKDLTLVICVPSLRCNAAHRIQRNIPRLQLAHPGFLA